LKKENAFLFEKNNWKFMEKISKPNGANE